MSALINPKRMQKGRRKMGDIADMMLDGTLCEQCGCYIGESVGYPRLCEDCQAEEG